MFNRRQPSVKLIFVNTFNLPGGASEPAQNTFALLRSGSRVCDGYAFENAGV